MFIIMIIFSIKKRLGVIRLPSSVLQSSRMTRKKNFMENIIIFIINMKPLIFIIKLFTFMKYTFIFWYFTDFKIL